MTFKCSRCKTELDATGVNPGDICECPACGKEIRVPRLVRVVPVRSSSSPGKVVSLVLLLAGIPAAAILLPPIVDAKVNGGFDTTTPSLRESLKPAKMKIDIQYHGYKRCPFCDEQIRPAASRCPHCQKDMPAWAVF